MGEYLFESDCNQYRSIIAYGLLSPFQLASLDLQCSHTDTPSLRITIFDWDWDKQVMH